MSPLSDRAPRDNGDEGRSSECEEAKTTSPWPHKSEWLPRGRRARHVDTANVGTWETHEKMTMMVNCEPKKENAKRKLEADDFKISSKLLLGVRWTHSSVEAR